MRGKGRDPGTYITIHYYIASTLLLFIYITYKKVKGSQNTPNK